MQYSSNAKPSLSGSESAFLGILFSNMSASKLRYAVLRNYDPLPYSAGGSDLDILVHPADFQAVRTVLFDAIKVAGGAPIGISESIGFFQVHALGQTTCSSRLWWGLRIDLYDGVYFRGNTLLDVYSVWPIRFHRGIPVIDDGFASILGALKEFINHGVLSGRYMLAARKEAVDGWLSTSALLAPMGNPAISRFQRLLLDGERDIVLKAECQSLRREFFQHTRSEVGVSAWLSLIRHQWSKFFRYLRPSGIVIAILGVDGAGKSTVIEAILPVLNDATHKAVFVRHLRPSVLPPLARFKGDKSEPKEPVLAPHGATPSGWLGSLFRLSYLTLDYIVGYWLWSRPHIAKLPSVVLFDRYAYDMALDPCRFRIGLPGRIAGWFAALAPKPDIIFCLHGDPTVIAARKKELSEEETRRQIHALRLFAHSEPRAVLISTDTSVKDTRDQVLLALIRYLTSNDER